MSKGAKIIIGLLFAIVANMMTVMLWAYKKYDKLSNEWWEIRRLYRWMGQHYTRLFERFKELRNNPDGPLKAIDNHIEYLFEEDMRDYDAFWSK